MSTLCTESTGRPRRLPCPAAAWSAPVSCSHAERPFAVRETLESGAPLGDDAYGSRKNSIEVDPRGALRLNWLAVSVRRVNPAGARTDTCGVNRFEANVRVSAGA